MDDMDVICTIEHYTVMKKKEILPYVTIWIKLKGIILKETSQKNKHCLIALMWIQTRVYRSRFMSMYGKTNTIL